MDSMDRGAGNGQRIESMLARLRPLMPDRVKRWSRSRERVGSDLRAMLDRQIMATYRRTTSKHSLPLLSLPPSEGNNNRIQLGKVQYAGPRHLFGLRESDLLRHTAIFGQSGSGKTHTVLHMIQQVAGKGVPVLFFDWKRTGRRFVQGRNNSQHAIYTAGRSVSPLPFNPFLPPQGVEPHIHAQQTVDLLAEAYTLGDGARSLLQRAITDQLESDPEKCMPSDLIRRVQDMADNTRSRQWAVTAERVLNELAFIRAAQSSRKAQDAFMSKLSRESKHAAGITFIELDALSLSGRAFIATAFTTWLYRARLVEDRRDQLSVLIVFEESHHLLNQREASRPSQLETLLRLVREVGIGAVLVDQTPSRISGVALANTFTTICLNTKHPADVQRAASVLGLPSPSAPEGRDVLLKLPVGCAVVRLAERWDQPFLVQVPPIELSESSLSDEQLIQHLNQTQESGHLRRGPPAFAKQSGTMPGVSRGPAADGVLSERSLALLRDILSFPDDGVKRRYYRLGLTVGAGHRLKSALLKAGYLEQSLIPFEHTHKAVLGLTKKARSELGLEGKKNQIDVALGRASIPHCYWQRWWARHLTSLGYETSVEAPRSSDEKDGRLDVLAKRDGEKLAIEIETGKSEFESNIRRDLRAGMDRVLVVATDTDAMLKIETRLANSGLLIRGRVELTLCDQLPESFR